MSWETLLNPLGTDEEKRKIIQFIDEILQTNAGKQLFKRLAKCSKNQKIVSVRFDDFEKKYNSKTMYGTHSQEGQYIELDKKVSCSIVLAHELIHACQPQTVSDLSIKTFATIKTYAITEKLAELDALLEEFIIFYELSCNDKKYYLKVRPNTIYGGYLYRYFLKKGKNPRQAKTEIAKIFWTGNVTGIKTPLQYKIAKAVYYWNEYYNNDLSLRSRYVFLDDKNIQLETRILDNLVKNMQINLTKEYFLTNGFYIYDIDKLGIADIETPVLGTKLGVGNSCKSILAALTFKSGKIAKFNAYKDGQLDFTIDYNKNGKKKVKDFYENGKYNGSYECYYYINGKIKKSITYKDGKFDGIWTKYFSNGKVKETITYKDDKLDGILTNYFSNGKVRETYFCKDGKFDGPSTYYFPNGKIKNTCFYKNGKLNGLSTSYSSNEKIKYEFTYKDGILNGEYVFYRKNGIKDCKGFYINGVKNGTQIQYRKDGQTPSLIHNILNDMRIGMSVAYYKDGKTVEITTSYIDDKRNGPRTYYKKDGSIKCIEIYKDDILVEKK